MNVRDEIVELRKKRLAAEGPFQGLPRPASRDLPLVPFLGAEGIVCEMKRASPSKGDIDPGFKAAERASLYAAGGARNVSVLTEQDRFRGSLADLAEVKRAHPGLSVLRKDFLLDRADVEASYLLGADAVLLIASMLDAATLADLASYAASLGMSAMVEVHDAEDVAKARAFKPGIVGINSRDLKSFRIDPLLPLKVRAMIDWEAKVVYESGIMDEADAAFPGSAGFQGILVGEAVTRDPGMVRAIREAFSGASRRAFWTELCGAMTGSGKLRTLVKVCGIREREGYRAALEGGADLVGFILAESPRKCEASFIRSLGEREGFPLRVAVVTDPPSAVDSSVLDLVEEGFIDAIQFHGIAGEGEAGAAAFKRDCRSSEAGKACVPYYKAERPRNAEDVKAFPAFGAPRILIDAHSPKGLGGTGERAAADAIEAARESLPGLWLAGGLKPDTVARAVRELRPELVDAASGTESSPGVKDPELVKKFLREVAHAT